MSENVYEFKFKTFTGKRTTVSLNTKTKPEELKFILLYGLTRLMSSGDELTHIYTKEEIEEEKKIFFDYLNEETYEDRDALLKKLRDVKYQALLVLNNSEYPDNDFYARIVNVKIKRNVNEISYDLESFIKELDTLNKDIEYTVLFSIPRIISKTEYNNFQEVFERMRRKEGTKV